MEAAEINNISEMEIMNMFPNIIEGGIQIAALKGNGCGLGPGSYNCCCSGYTGCCNTQGQCITTGGTKC